MDNRNSNLSHQERRKKAMEFKSPWSSGSGSTSPLPNRLSLFDKSYSGGSTNSLGSSPGAEVKTLTNQSSLTVPEVNLPPVKVNRSTSPFHFGSRGRKEKKRLEKQPYCLDDPTVQSLSSQSSVGTSFEQDACDQLESESKSKSSKTTTSFFRRKRKGSSPFSLNLMRNKKSSEKQEIPCTANSNSLLHPDGSFSTSFGDCGTSPPPLRGRRSMSRSPPSPASQCKCRRCSILHLEECEPKEMNALFKFLRKSKVCKRSCFSFMLQTHEAFSFCTLKIHEFISMGLLHTRNEVFEILALMHYYMYIALYVSVKCQNVYFYFKPSGQSVLIFLLQKLSRKLHPMVHLVVACKENVL